MIKIPVSLIEFKEGGNKVYVHDGMGAMTCMRIQTRGQVKVLRGGTHPVSVLELTVDEDIEVRLADDAVEEGDVYRPSKVMRAVEIVGQMSRMTRSDEGDDWQDTQPHCEAFDALISKAREIMGVVPRTESEEPPAVG